MKKLIHSARAGPATQMSVHTIPQTPQGAVPFNSAVTAAGNMMKPSDAGSASTTTPIAVVGPS